MSDQERIDMLARDLAAYIVAIPEPERAVLLRCAAFAIRGHRKGGNWEFRLQLDTLTRVSR